MSKKKIAIVTPNFRGPLNAAIKSLANDGHEVTVILAEETIPDLSQFISRKKEFLKAGVLLELLKKPAKIKSSLLIQRSYAVYEMLKNCDFDIIHFPERGGLGYFCMMAKKQGLYFSDAKLFITDFASKAGNKNTTLPSKITDIQVLQLERKSAEWSDAIEALSHPKVPKKEKISVCISHKDRPHFLKRALQSIENQTYKNYEVVLVDDGSKSKSTRTFIQKLRPCFRKKNWQIILHRESLGPSAARQTAASHAHGKFLLFMDDDNIAKPEELKTLLTVATNTGADIVTCGFDIFSGDHPEFTKKTRRWIPYSPEIDQNVFFNAIGDTNSLFRRSTYRELGGFESGSGGGWEDFKLLMEAALKDKKIETCPEALFWYRKHSNNFSSRLDSFKTIQTRLECFKNIGNKDLSNLVALLISWENTPRTL